MEFGLTDKTLEKIRSVLANYPKVDRAVIYGSRAKGNYRNGSDIDLTLFGKSLDQKQCADIADALDELLLPYMIDLSIYELLDHEGLKEHINRVGKVFYCKRYTHLRGVERF